jgi:hypothetical protein
MCEENWNDIREQIEYEAETKGDREREAASIISPWESFKTTESPSNLQTIIEIAEASIWTGLSNNVARYLFLFNSKAVIIEGPDNHKLVALPDIGVIVDLFSITRDFFIGPKYKYIDPNSVIDEILTVIGRKGYVYNSLTEAQSVIKALQKDCYLYAHKIEKEDIVAQGSHIFKNYKEDFCKILLNKLFYGEHNWVCCMSYQNSVNRFKHSLLPYDVVCYECMPYIREEGQYCIETKLPLDVSKVNVDDYNENRRIAILTCQSANDPKAEGWQGETALKFLGIYNLDIAKSKEGKYLAFKLASKRLYI